MDCSRYMRGHAVFDKLTPLFRETIFCPQESLRGCRSKAHDHLRLNERHLRFEPRLASLDLRHARLLVQAPFAALLEFEVFHRVSHVNVGPLDACLFQRSVQQLTSGSNEWTSLPVFFVAWLFPHQRDPRRPRSLAKHRLSRVTVKFTSAAALNLFPKSAQRGVFGYELA